MPRPTNTEIIRQLDRAVAKLEVQVDYQEDETTRLQAAHVKIVETWMTVEARVAVLETRLDESKRTWEARFEELKKLQEEADRRRWQVNVLLIGSLLTFVANIIVVFFRR